MKIILPQAYTISLLACIVGAPDVTYLEYARRSKSTQHGCTPHTRTLTRNCASHNLVICSHTDADMALAHLILEPEHASGGVGRVYDPDARDCLHRRIGHVPRKRVDPHRWAARSASIEVCSRNQDVLLLYQRVALHIEVTYLRRKMVSVWYAELVMGLF